LSISARFDLFSPKSTAPFVKSSVSGELMYLAAFASASSTRPAEGNDFPDVVADRKHHPAAKPIVKLTVGSLLIAQLHQAALHQFLHLIVMLSRELRHRIPRVRRKSQFPALRHLAADPAAFK
jgi:hypothetical protein